MARAIVCHQAEHKWFFFLNVFLLNFDHSSPLYSLAEQVAIWGSYGRDEARAPGLPFLNA